ncbi:uncharacterized protein HMPREF1541_03676 [Cyphellophora europaea CBS 101466]|uniref:Uncharacterized protein n=1 Tax=Cyphellophora europaea (strain CBS 101466) TaxID=1220924 RepID=W2S194_CYPE1|nr:uncharacterized protein HMPREF1541_03676 [Cyphellophora europaea CBS 101466]ETN41739.1 hypothetical protein HMPREF1541_03676 [Cyphellophora europaea CBS 101466]
MDEIDGFFSSYPEFDYDRSASSPREFYRMCDQFGWRKDKDGLYPREGQTAHAEFRKAMVRGFNSGFGVDVNSPAAWESMCHLLRISPVPDTLQGMRDAVKSIYVNLSDLLDGRRSGTRIRTFDTREELAAYTIREGRIFPKKEAYAGGILRYLLREITGTYEVRRADATRGGRGRSGRGRGSGGKKKQ